jgi:hypothetical protein
MLIRLRGDGSVITDHQFRAAHPATSFPPVLSEELLADFGADPVLEGPQPTLTRYQTAAMDGVRQNGANWITNWIAMDMDADACAALDARQADAVRTDRNARLAVCDWTQLADAPVDSLSWANYRQALRDVTMQPGFPWSVEWPTPPA